MSKSSYEEKIVLKTEGVRSSNPSLALIRTVGRFLKYILDIILENRIKNLYHKIFNIRYKAKNKLKLFFSMSLSQLICIFQPFESGYNINPRFLVI